MKRSEIEAILNRLIATYMAKFDGLPVNGGSITFREAADQLEAAMVQMAYKIPLPPKRTKAQTSLLNLEIESAHELANWPNKLRDVKGFLELAGLKNTELQFFNASYWQSLEAWLTDSPFPVYLEASFHSYLAWHRSLPKASQKKEHKRAFRNWVSRDLSRAEWKHGRDQTAAKRY